MRNIFHSFSLNSEWFDKLSEQAESKVLDNRMILFPEEIGAGHAYFAKAAPGVSVLLVDLSLNIPLKFCRENSAEELWVFHFDLSEHASLIEISDSDYVIGSCNRSALAVLDGKTESFYTPAVQKRTFAMMLLVDKKVLASFIGGSSNPKCSKSEKDCTADKGELRYYGNMDSNSLLLLKSLKAKPIRDLTFDPFIKGVALKLLGNFFRRFDGSQNPEQEVGENEKLAIGKTRDYLLSNLHSPFPSVDYLASMSGMSKTKYKILFAKCYSTSPNAFFLREKVKLSRKLLKSGKFYSIANVLNELNYCGFGRFSRKYFECFNKRPKEDFIRGIQSKKERLHSAENNKRQFS